MSVAKIPRRAPCAVRGACAGRIEGAERNINRSGRNTAETTAVAREERTSFAANAADDWKKNAHGTSIDYTQLDAIGDGRRDRGKQIWRDGVFISGHHSAHAHQHVPSVRIVDREGGLPDVRIRWGGPGRRRDARHRGALGRALRRRVAKPAVLLASRHKLLGR